MTPTYKLSLLSSLYFIEPLLSSTSWRSEAARCPANIVDRTLADDHRGSEEIQGGDRLARLSRRCLGGGRTTDALPEVLGSCVRHPVRTVG